MRVFSDEYGHDLRRLVAAASSRRLRPAEQLELRALLAEINPDAFAWPVDLLLHNARTTLGAVVVDRVQEHLSA